MYAFLLSYHPYRECVHLEQVEDHDAHHCRGWEGLKVRLFFCSVASCVLLTSFWALVTYLVYADTTTIEFLSFADRKRQREAITVNREAHLINNLQTILGPWPYWWRYLIAWKPLHDAIPPFQHS